MSSEKQTTANQANAQKSTGPRTPEGKAAVSQNAFQHGLRSRRAVMQGENQEEFDQLCAQLHEEWQPQNPTEDQYVQRLAVSLWKMDRMEKLESDFFCEVLFRDPHVKFLQIVWQQQTRLERAYDKALAELQRLRKLRAVAPAEPDSRDKPTKISEQPAPKPAQPEYVMHAAQSPGPVAVPRPAAPAAPGPPRTS